MFIKKKGKTMPHFLHRAEDTESIDPIELKVRRLKEREGIDVSSLPNLTEDQRSKLPTIHTYVFKDAVCLGNEVSVLKEFLKNSDFKPLEHKEIQLWCKKFVSEELADNIEKDLRAVLEAKNYPIAFKGHNIVPDDILMMDFDEKVRTIRNTLKSLCKTLRVRRGSGTDYCWIHIWGSEDGKFNEEEKKALETFGLVSYRSRDDKLYEHAISPEETEYYYMRALAILHGNK
jgi:hypothetical protein